MTFMPTQKIKSWYKRARVETFLAYQCQNAKHELDNEIDPIGSSARRLTLDFINTQNCNLQKLVLKKNKERFIS